MSTLHTVFRRPWSLRALLPASHSEAIGHRASLHRFNRRRKPHGHHSTYRLLTSNSTTVPGRWPWRRCCHGLTHEASSPSPLKTRALSRPQVRPRRAIRLPNLPIAQRQADLAWIVAPPVLRGSHRDAHRLKWKVWSNVGKRPVRRCVYRINLHGGIRRFLGEQYLRWHAAQGCRRSSVVSL